MKSPSDDRGRRVTLQSLDQSTRDRSWELRRVSPQGVVGFSAYQIWWFVFFVVLWAVLGAVAHQALGLDTWIIGGLSGGLGGTAAVLIVKRDSRRRFRERRETALKAGCCPACWYDIANIQAAIHGCVVCPECGAAWNLLDAPRKGPA